MFYRNKYTRWYNHIINLAKLQDRKKLSKTDPNFVYYEKHHIIPTSLGGNNLVENIVLLTGREHFIVHILLPKMCIDPNHIIKMYNASFLMGKKNKKYKDRYVNSRLYEYAKTHLKLSEDTKQKLGKQISCLDLNTGNYLRVDAEVFRNSDNLVGVNSGKKGQKRSDAFKQSITGSGNSFYGKKHSTETKQLIGQNISKKIKGVPKSEEHKIKIRNALLGKPKTETHKSNISKARLIKSGHSRTE